MDRRGASIVPPYKRKGNKYGYRNYKDISLSSVVDKLFGRVLIERVRVELNGE